MVLIDPQYFNRGDNKMKTIDQCWLCDDFLYYFDIIQLFLGHGMDMVHSCIAMLQVQTIYSKHSAKILILIKKLQKNCFP